MLYYSIDHPDPDNNFTVTVVPINGAGPGEDTSVIFQFSAFTYNDTKATCKMCSEKLVAKPEPSNNYLAYYLFYSIIGD